LAHPVCELAIRSPYGGVENAGLDIDGPPPSSQRSDICSALQYQIV